MAMALAWTVVSEIKSESDIGNCFNFPKTKPTATATETNTQVAASEVAASVAVSHRGRWSLNE